MNKAFNKFVAKYQCAYQGPNTLKGQIDANVKKAAKTSKEDFDFKLMIIIIITWLCVTEYCNSDVLDGEMGRPGCECLPLGRSFQEHVKRFTAKTKCVPLIYGFGCKMNVRISYMQTLDNYVSFQVWSLYNCQCGQSS